MLSKISLLGLSQTTLNTLGFPVPRSGSWKTYIMTLLNPVFRYTVKITYCKNIPHRRDMQSDKGNQITVVLRNNECKGNGGW
jgi:hypothetical protein